MLNLDTHILVALFTGEVSDEERRCVSNQRLAISGVVLWELVKLLQRGRLTLDLDGPEFRAWLRSLTVLPITLENCPSEHSA